MCIQNTEKCPKIAPALIAFYLIGGGENPAEYQTLHSRRVKLREALIHFFLFTPPRLRSQHFNAFSNLHAIQSVGIANNTSGFCTNIAPVSRHGDANGTPAASWLLTASTTLFTERARLDRQAHSMFPRCYVAR